MIKITLDKITISIPTSNPIPLNTLLSCSTLINLHNSTLLYLTILQSIHTPNPNNNIILSMHTLTNNKINTLQIQEVQTNWHMIIVLFVTKWPTQSFNKNPFSSLGLFAFFYSALLFYFFGFLFVSNPVSKEESNVSTAKESNL